MSKEKINNRGFSFEEFTRGLSDWNTNTTNKFFGNSFGKGLSNLGIKSGNLGGIANSVATGLGNALAGKNRTGVGTALQGIGSLASNIPGIGGLIGAGVNLLGGITNAAFGSNLNEEFIKDTELSAALLGNYISNASTTSELLSDFGTYQDLAKVNKSDVGTEGWFSDAASDETKRLNEEIRKANALAQVSLINTADKINTQNTLAQLSNVIAYGGPINMLYSGSMSPFGNRFELGGPKDWDNTLLGRLINYVENRDSIGLDRTKQRWYAPPANKGYDRENRGMGIDTKENAYVIPKLKVDKRGSYLTVKDERDIRYKSIDDAEKSYGERLKYALKVTKSTNTPSEMKKAITMSAIYNLGSGFVANNLFEDKLLMRNLMFGSDEEYANSVHKYYKAKDRNERILLEKDFMKKNKKAEGGPLTHGGVFSNGVEIIGNGGTHEENPLEGVPMGIDPQGIPNLVEEGELIWNDYVFSNRLKVPKAIRLKYKLRETTFAEAAKDLLKESEERPNDPISKSSLDAMFSDLAMSQEEIRMRKESNKYAKGGKLGNLFEDPGPEPNVLIDYPYGMYDGKSPYDYSRYFTLDPNNKNKVVSYTDAYKNARFNLDLAKLYASLMGDKDTSLKDFLAKGNKIEDLTEEDVAKHSLDNKYGWLHNARAWAMDTLNDAPALATPNTRAYVPTLYSVLDFEPEESTDLTPAEDASIKNNWLRYAPIVGHAIGAFSDLFSDVDYSAANTIADTPVNPALVGFNPVGNYLRYNPLDRDYYINKLNADSNATKRSIMNTSGGNRAAALTGLLAADYNYGNQLGALARQAEEYNLAQRQQVEDFNRATNMFNSEAGLKASMTNADSRNKMTQLRLQKAALVAAARQAAKEAYNARRSNNINVLLEELGGLGTEETYKNWLDFLADKGVFKINTEGKKNSKEGKLNKKKGFTYG